ncbi:MAG TPA: LamG domain-containing protein [Chitinophagaceae bacterium]
MKTKYRNVFNAFAAGICVVMLVTACTKPELDDDFQKGDPPPIGSYTNSSEVAAADLVAFFPFEGSFADSKGAVPGGTASGGATFAAGKKGQAYQGTSTGFVSYTGSGPLGTLTSFTVSMWINTSWHQGGAQSLFTVTKADGSFWGNFFMLIEGATTGDPMLVKVHFEKNVTPSIPNTEHWLETTGNLRINDMYGAWRHIVYSYDAATSKFKMFANGNKVNFPATAENRTQNGTTPLGDLAFKSPARFVIGAFQNQLGAPYNNPEPWMLPYTGRMDELRFYKRALTDQEINALFQLEKQGR